MPLIFYLNKLNRLLHYTVYNNEITRGLHCSKKWHNDKKMAFKDFALTGKFHELLIMMTSIRFGLILHSAIEK